MFWPDRPATFFLAGAAAGPGAAGQTVAAFYRGSAQARFCRAAAGAQGATTGFGSRRRSRSQGKFGATVDLTGQVPMNDDQFSVIRQQRVARHVDGGARRPDRSMAGASLLEDHRSRVLQPDGRAGGDGGARACHGRLLQPDLDRVLRAVRRPWRRLRHSVQRALSRRAARASATCARRCGGLPARRQIRWRWRPRPPRWDSSHSCRPITAGFRSSA